MGLVGNRRKPPLPAPTESLSGVDPDNDSPEEDYVPAVAPSDLETTLTTHTDKTSYEVPEDGSPVTINTTKQTRDRNELGAKLTKGKSTKVKGSSSQTSLLIEYFEEGGGEKGRRPSVRVRVTPSKKGQQGVAGAGQGSVRITERNSQRPSYTRSISLGKGEEGISHVIESNISSLESESIIGRDRAPVEVQVRNMGFGSDALSRLEDEESRFVPVNPSEISSMPPDSMLEGGRESPIKLNRRRSRSLEREEVPAAMDTLKPKTQRTRSLSREREVARRAVEKFEERERRHKEKEREHKRSTSGKHKSRLSKESLPGEKSRRKSSKSYDQEESVSSANPSLLTGSQVSGLSARSAESTASSIKNPKLLQTVEDAIRRLILPEINALKNEQKSNRRSSKYDDDSSPASSVRSEEIRHTRKTSGPKLKLNGDTIKSSKGSRRSGGKDILDSPDREYSDETVVREESKSRRRSKDKARDAAIGAAAAGLTAAALKSKDSASSIERRERRKKRSKSATHSRTSSRAESRTDSQADSVDAFTKHAVPQMPMGSGVGLTDSDMTRDSILSERTSTPTNERTKAVRDLVRESPNEFSPGGSETPTGHLSPVEERWQEFSEEDEENRHDFFDSVHLKREPPQRNLAAEYPHDDEYDDEDDYPADPYPQQRPYVPHTYTDPNYGSPGYGFQRRGLSPIQSVTSHEERDEPAPAQRESLHRARSSTSMSSVDRELHAEPSVNSLSSGTADMIRRKEMRPKPLNFETARETLQGYQSPVNKVTGGRVGQNVRTIGSNPELITTPHGVESAVASLLEPSTIGGQSNLSYGSNERGSNRYSLEADQRRDSLISQDRNLHTPERSSPLKRELQPHDLNERMMSPSYQRQASLTPSRERPGSSPFIDNPLTGASALPREQSPMPEPGYEDDDIETNPSPIQGPGGADVLGAGAGAYATKAPRSNDSSIHDNLNASAQKMLEAAGAMGAGAALVQGAKAGKLDHWNRDSYPSPPQSEGLAREVLDSPSRDREMPKGEPGSFTPAWQADYTPHQPWDKDEGYNSGVPRLVPSDGSLTPDHRRQKDIPPGIFGMNLGGDLGEDPFLSPGKGRPMTGRSDAMSPVYDSATGRGLDRIQNKDIVALMDHLTVRDAQRNARDTEILVTLVRSAAEMRNSFDEMKQFVDSKNNQVLNETRQQGEQTRRAIGGPRAMPSKGLSSRGSEDMTEDVPDKRRSVFRRALQGLGGGNKKDLGNIEKMLMQLLDEVADIKAAQQTSPPQASNYSGPIRSSGLTTYENLRDAPGTNVETYQPSGKDSVEPRNDSGYSSANSSYKPTSNYAHARRGSEALRASQNRVSTVAEDENEDEDMPLDERDQKILGDERAEALLTPTRDFRGGEFDNPPTSGAPRNGQLSVEATPNNRKHRSGSGGFVQKISRWSKTTASSIPGIDATPKQGVATRRPVSELSHSASDLDAQDDYDVRNHYDPAGDDRLRSKTSLSQHSAASAATSKQYRPPSPLIPSHVSEKPTYSAHRDSQDLQHPQPRQGPTARYQNHLESEAARHIFATGEGQDSPTSDVLGNNPVLSRNFGGREAGNRYSGVSAGGELSPINESSRAPSLPPKVKDEGPLIPPKVPLAESEEGSPNEGKAVSFADRMVNANSGMPQRKPTGPRPITRSGSYSPAGGMSGLDEYKKGRYSKSPAHVEEYYRDGGETF